MAGECDEVQLPDGAALRTPVMIEQEGRIPGERYPSTARATERYEERHEHEFTDRL